MQQHSGLLRLEAVAAQCLPGPAMEGAAAAALLPPAVLGWEQQQQEAQ